MCAKFSESYVTFFPQHDSSVESSLTIGSVTLSDSGIYKCTSDAASQAQVAVLVTSGE